MPCHKCSNQNYISGSHYIECKNPPLIVAKFPNGSPEMREKAKEYIVKMQEEHPEIEVVSRCIWDKSGTFPVYYDPNTVLTCTNHNKTGDGTKKVDPSLQMLAILQNEK